MRRVGRRPVHGHGSLGAAVTDFRGRKHLRDTQVQPRVRPHLVVAGGPAPGATLALPDGRSRVGRRPDCEVLLADPSVSRLHATVTVRDGSVTVEDRASTKGTWVAGRRITTPVEVRDGDTIRFGDVTTVLSWLAGDAGVPALEEADHHGDTVDPTQDTLGGGEADDRRQPSTLRRLLKQTQTTLVSVGTVAAAITAIAGLLGLFDDRPPPPTETRATVLAVDVLNTRTPLSSYQPSPPVLVAAAGALGTVPPGGLSPVAASAETGTEPAPEGTTSGEPSPDPSGTATTPGPTPEPSTDTGTSTPDPTTSPRPVGVLRRMEPLLEELAPEYHFPVDGDPDPPPAAPSSTDPPGRSGESPRPGVAPAVPSGELPENAIAAAAASGPRNETMTARTAARRVVRFLRQVRTLPITTTSGRRQWEPVGALVDVDLELAGLRGEQVVLRWQVIRVGDTEPLFGRWLHQVEARTVTPEADHATATVQLWVPLPKGPGPYVVRVAVVRGESELGTRRSNPF